MVKTTSTMLPLGTLAPDFTLPDTVSGKLLQFSDVRGPAATLIMFICNHCPFVKHIQPELVRLARDYQGRGIGIAAINSNDVENYPEDSPQKMQLEARRLGYVFPYLYDESQQVAKDYNAVCTPDFFLFDDEDRCVYRGQLDRSRPGNDYPSDGSDLRQALDHLLAGKPVPADQQPSVGCNIKWKS